MLFHPFTERIQSRREDGMCFLLPLQPLPRPCPLPGAPATFSICILTACAACDQISGDAPPSPQVRRHFEWASEHRRGPAGEASRVGEVGPGVGCSLCLASAHCVKAVTLEPQRSVEKGQERTLAKEEPRADRRLRSPTSSSRRARGRNGLAL